MNLEIDDLTLGEIEDLEDATGIDMMQVDWAKPTLKLIRAFAWLMARRVNPALTFEEARNIKLGDLDLDGDTVPNAGGGRAARTATSRTSPRSSTSTAGSRRKRSGL